MTDINSSPTFQPSGINFFLVGFMGSGKTHWGKIWAVANKLSFIDLDEEIEKKAGKTIAEIFESGGEEEFRKMEARALRNCALLENTIIACGGGTPCFFENMQWMNDHGTTIYLSATPGQILQRILSEQEKRPLVSRLSGAELLLFIETKIIEREPVYTQAKVQVQSSLLTENSFTEIISNTY